MLVWSVPSGAPGLLVELLSANQPPLLALAAELAAGPTGATGATGATGPTGATRPGTINSDGSADITLQFSAGTISVGSPVIDLYASARRIAS